MTIIIVMAFKQEQNSVLVFAVYMVLVITSAGNFKFNAAAQQYEAKTLEGGCPDILNSEKFNQVRNKLLQNIGPLIEQLRAMQSPTTEQVNEQSTESPTTGQTTKKSLSLTTDPLEPCGGPGWRQVVFINMTDTSYDCPPGLNLTSYSKRTCGRAHSNPENCSSTTFSTGGSEYSQVCGRIRGYQVGGTSAFYGYLRDSQGIDGYYVDGVSLTHGPVGERQHIWSFASGTSEFDEGRLFRQEMCPCDTTNNQTVSPLFVGNDYFCESGFHYVWNFMFIPFLNDPLWDGENCLPTSTCCQFNNPPWFTKTLPNPTTDDIELRLCLIYWAGVDDVALELIELYVQ